jgi:hypothetical protein
MTILAVDVSQVAVEQARKLAKDSGVESQCRFSVHDLDQGLPISKQVNLVFCHLYRDPLLDEPIIDCLLPGGLLAMACLSEVGVEPGEFRVPAGELEQAFGTLEIIEADEAAGMAKILARKPMD